MLASYITGLAGVVLLTLAWVAVQGAWRRAFPDASTDPDALAGRMGCHGCAGRECGGSYCQRQHGERKQGRIGTAEEETS